MQHGTAAYAAFRTLRRFSAATTASGLSHHSQSSCTDAAFTRDPLFHHVPLKQPCNRAPLGLHFETFSSGTETSMAVDMRLSNNFEANMFAEQGCASATLEELNAEEMHRYSGSEPSKGTINCISSSSHLPEEVHRRNHLDNMVEQHNRSIALLSSQLEAQRQSLNSVLEELKHLKVDSGCKAQCFSVPPANKASLDVANVSASSFTDQAAQWSSPPPDNEIKFDITSGSTDQPAHPWPEWTHFIEHVRSLPFFKDLVEGTEVAGVSFAEDSTIIKRMLPKFSQAYGYIFDALSVKHLQTLADHGCPNDDRRTVASYKRLKDHFQAEKKSVSKGVTSSELDGSKPKLLDVIRLLYMIAELAKKDRVADKVKLSILHLLEEIIKLTSVCKHGHNDRSETFSNSRGVLQNLPTEKSLGAKLGLQHSSSSTGAKSLLGSDKWECARCSYFNHEGKNTCVKCNFQRPDTVMRKRSIPAANRIDMKGDEEDKEPSVLASQRHTVMDDNRQAAGSPEKENLLGTQEKVFQMCMLSDQEEKALGGSGGARDGSNANEHPDIFDDIFDQGETASARLGPKCSLSELVRQNKEAFSSIIKQREQGIADDHGRKGMGPSTDRRHKYDDIDASQRAVVQGPVQDDSDPESENKYMRQRKGSGGRAKHNHINSLVGSVGKGLAGRVHNDDRQRRTKSMELFDTDEDTDDESETESFVSSRTYGNQRSRPNKKRHRGDRERFSDCESGSRRGGFERRTREGRPRDIW